MKKHPGLWPGGRLFLKSKRLLLLFGEKVGKILDTKRKSGSFREVPAPGSLPRCEPHLHSDTVAPQGLLYCLSRRYARGILVLRGHPGIGSGHHQRRTERSETCFLLWPAPCCMAGKTSLTRTACTPSWMPPQPVVGGEPPGTCQRDSRGPPPDPFARVQRKSQEAFCRVVVFDPARQFSFCPAGGDGSVPPAFPYSGPQAYANRRKL